MLLPLHPSDVIGSALHFPVHRGAVPQSCRASWAGLGEHGGHSRLRDAGPRLRSGRSQGSSSGGHQLVTVLGGGAHACCVRTSTQVGSVSSSGALNALERHCSQCPRLNLPHLLTMPTLSLRGIRFLVQAHGCIGQE